MVMIKNSLIRVCAAMGFAVIMLSGCARDITSSNYTASSVGEASTSYEGVIKNVRVVVVDENDRLQNNVIGGLIGAAAGGYAGSGIGKGQGQDAAIIAGSLLGATAGALAEKHIKRQQGYEYTVQLKNGGMMTVVQGTDTALSVGQRVIVHVSYNGRSRVVAY